MQRAKRGIPEANRRETWYAQTSRIQMVSCFCTALGAFCDSVGNQSSDAERTPQRMVEGGLVFPEVSAARRPYLRQKDSSFLCSYVRQNLPWLLTLEGVTGVLSDKYLREPGSSPVTMSDSNSVEGITAMQWPFVKLCRSQSSSRSRSGPRTDLPSNRSWRGSNI